MSEELKKVNLNVRIFKSSPGEIHQVRIRNIFDFFYWLLCAGVEFSIKI